VFNPALAFIAMFVAGLAHGLHPDLTPADSSGSTSRRNGRVR
jgi:hypothetical protein